MGNPDFKNQINKTTRDISVILPVLNEDKYLDMVLRDLVEQEYSLGEIEVLIIAGKSNDRTPQIVEIWKTKYPNRLRVFNNSQKNVGTSFNIGIKHARYPWIAIFGAHSRYPKDYLSVCMKVLKEMRADACSGRTVLGSITGSMQEELCMMVLESPFGTSSSSFRNAKEGFSVTIPRAVYKREILESVGGYDEQLVRNQDNDINQRLVKEGYKLFYSHAVESVYYGPTTCAQLLKKAIVSGSWNAVTFNRNKRAMQWYHFVPAGFTLVSFVALVAEVLIYVKQGAWIPFSLLVFGPHLLAGTCFSWKGFDWTFRTLKQNIMMPFLFLAYHLSYGIGTLRGFLMPTIR